jgi:signal transduction histidine kinase
LFRLRPEAGTSTRALLVFSGTYLLAFLAAALTMLPAEVRMRRMAAAARASAREKYASMVPIGGRDEISAMGAAFNEAAADLRRRAADVRDREEALQRHVTHTTEDVAVPLSALEQQLAALDAGSVLSPPVRTGLRGALREAHHLVSRLNNLAAVTRLRTSAERLAREPVDLGAVVERVVATRSAVARVEGVDVHASIPSEPVTWPGDPILFEQMVANVVDNAVMHNRAGGRVEIELKGYEGGRFTLRVTDDGPGVTDDAFAELTANRRFRGDEGRSGRGGRGLGLAIARLNSAAAAFRRWLR